MKIKEISNVWMGLLLNRKKAPVGKGAKEYPLLTLKSFDLNGIINREELERFESSEILPEKYTAREGDIVLRLSEPNTAIYITKEFEGLLISSHFAIIRIKKSKIIPEFIAWYLNSDSIKKQIRKLSAGSVLSVIKTKSLNEFKIKEISIEKQRKIVGINKLQLKERELTLQLLEEKEKLYKELIKGIMNNQGGQK